MRGLTPQKAGAAMKILLAIDFSKGSEPVLDEVVARPWAKGTEFLVLHVVDLRNFGRFPAIGEDTKKQASAWVKAAADEISKTGYQCSSQVIIGAARTAIAEFTKDWNANFVVVGSHGHTSIGRFLLGSVAQALLRNSPCSVEIVRPRASGALSSSLARKILLATDGSEFSLAAAKSVAIRPWPAGTQIKILSVQEIPAVENQTSAFPLAAVYPASLLEELIENSRNHAAEAVEGAKRIFADTDLQLVNTDCIPLGEPRLKILDKAQEWAADLIVLGSHGRCGLDRILMGSVSETVAIHAKCSVEVIRPDRLGA